jgi:phosphopantetheinyl transferase
VPVFFQQQINETTRLAIWKIEEPESFFLGNVPLQTEVTHPKKRLQHLTGRFLLQFLFPDFPYELIRIADTRKPFLEDEQYHFSISHAGDYAAAIVSREQRVGIDIEMPSEKVERIRHKFLGEGEAWLLRPIPLNELTLLWCAKESVFKWYGKGQVDFRKDIYLKKIHSGNETIDVFFHKTNDLLEIRYHDFNPLILTWLVS